MCETQSLTSGEDTNLWGPEIKTCDTKTEEVREGWNVWSI